MFGDQVKLIKADFATNTQLGITGAYYDTYSNVLESSGTYKGSNYSNIASYSWNNNTNNNTWSGSALNTTNLNGTYLTHLGTTWTDKIAETSWK